MLPADKPIAIRVLCDGEEHELKAYEGEYRSLMMLIYDQIFIPFFGECKGMGRCSTCMVVIDSKEPVKGMDRNEQATIAKSGRPYHPDYRLACQILIDPSLHQAVVQILGEDEIG